MYESHWYFRIFETLLSLNVSRIYTYKNNLNQSIRLCITNALSYNKSVIYIIYESVIYIKVAFQFLTHKLKKHMISFWAGGVQVLQYLCSSTKCKSTGM